MITMFFDDTDIEAFDLIEMQIINAVYDSTDWGMIYVIICGGRGA